MRLLTASCLLAATLCLSGCGDLLSLHPIYTAQDKVFDPAVEGRWESESDLLVISRSKDAYTFTLEAKKPPKNGPRSYEAHLVDIRGIRFVDIIPESSLGHMFAKVQVKDGELRVTFLDSKWVRAKIPHEDSEVAANETMPVVTLKTAVLRRLVAKYALEPRAYDKGLVFQRSK